MMPLFILLWIVFIVAIMDDPEGVMLSHLERLESEINELEADHA